MKKHTAKTEEKKAQYLSGVAMAKTSVKKYIFLIIGGLIIALCAFGLFEGISNPDIGESRSIYAVFLILFGWMFYSGIRASRDLENARRYDTAFRADKNEALKLSTLADQTGKRVDQVEKELERLFRKGFFKGCSLIGGKEAAVVFTETGNGKQKSSIQTVTCPHCGATNHIRVGSHGACEYCGGALE